MDSTLSSEEFQRLQTQLLELKTDNYSLAEEKRRDQSVIDGLRQRVETLEKQLSRAQTVNKINPLSLARNIANKVDHKLRSGADTSSDHLIAENELLIRRIESQEQEFRVTNNTLKEEIHSLVATNQSLEDQLRGIRANPPIECDLGRSGGNSDANSGGLGDSGGDPMAANHLSFAILAEKEKLELKVYDLQEEVKNMQKENQSMVTLVEELRSRCRDTEKLGKDLSDSSDMIERQNSLIEEMRGHKMEMELKFKADCDKLRSEHQLKVDGHESRLRCSDETNDALSDRIRELTDQLKEMEIIDKQNDKLINELESYKEELSFCRTQSEDTVERLNREQKQVLDQLSAKHTHEMESIRQECDLYMSRIADLEAETNGLNQRILDDIEDRKIHEKKGVLMVKELKRQLHSERKRADKLQERLHELLNESTASISSDIQRKQSLSHNNGNNGNDSSSVGSWSFMSAKDNSNFTHNRTSSLHSCGSDGRESTTSPVSPGLAVVDSGSGGERNGGSLLEKENNELVARITGLQQEKWTLEERINQLELSVTAMSEDMARKIDIIQYYSMEGRPDPHRHHSAQQSALHSTDKLTVKRVVDFIKDKGDENQREINRKVQRMLEETLTKNMHLQQNLDSMSREVVRLNQLIGSNAVSKLALTTDH